MSLQVIQINCPTCGARATIDQKECEWCGNPLIISSFNSVYSMPTPEVNKFARAYSEGLAASPNDRVLNNSAAMCWLKLKLYAKAIPAFEKAMQENFDNSETFFYAAVALLQGKKAFVQQRTTIDKIVEYINAALMIEPKGIYYYFLAYIKYDYFERKFLNVKPNFKETLRLAKDAGYSEFDVDQLYSILGIDRPAVL